MSTDDENELLIAMQSMRASLKVLNFVVTVFGIGIASGLIWIFVIAANDHYDQISLRKDSDWMMPRVTKLWYFGNKQPDDVN